MPRTSQIQTWLQPWLKQANAQPIQVAGDASFRSYYRFSAQQTKLGSSLILMDAPPELESSASFIALAEAWAKAGVRVPQVIASDLTLGVALLEDLGDQQLMQAVQGQPASAAQLYPQALRQLAELQLVAQDAAAEHFLPAYDRALLERELHLFDTWLLEQLLEIPATSWPSNWQGLQEHLISQALAQPQVCVHRDYHSRNLMCLEADELGVIDFQDAVYGPCTYDAVSLIRDCYLDWPPEQQQEWLAYFHQLYNQNFAPVSLAEFSRWFDFMGMQRHLKAAGIFARLYLRDGKAGFLADIPLTLQHLIRALAQYHEFSAEQAWLIEVVAPKVQEFLAAQKKAKQGAGDA